MKKLIPIVALILFSAGTLFMAPTANAHFIGEEHMHDKKDPNIFWLMPQTTQDDWGYHDWRKDNPRYDARFDHQHPDYYDNYSANKHNTQKTYYVNDPDDNCDWEYNLHLDTWICANSNPSYTSYHPDFSCPYGYVRHENRNECVAVRTPTNAHLNANGDGWECNSGYKMNYRENGCERIKQDVYVYDAFSSNGLTYANNSTDTYRVYNAASSEYVYPYGTTSASRLPTTGLGSGLLLLGSIFGGYKIARRKK